MQPPEQLPQEHELPPDFLFLIIEAMTAATAAIRIILTIIVPSINHTPLF